MASTVQKAEKAVIRARKSYGKRMGSKGKGKRFASKADRRLNKALCRNTGVAGGAQ